MNLYKALNIEKQQKEMICFIGGGGKTSSIFQLANELKQQGKSVLVTTTTAIYQPTPNQYDELVLWEINGKDFFRYGKVKSGITVIGGTITAESKLLSPTVAVIETIFSEKLFDVILVEADGAKKLPIKAPAEHEPVIPRGTTKVVGVMGIEVLEDRIIQETVHRWELFCKITESNPCGKIDIDKIVKLILHREGTFRGVPVGCCKYLLINKVDNQQRKENALKIVRRLKGQATNLKGIIISSVIKQVFNLIEMEGGQ